MATKALLLVLAIVALAAVAEGAPKSAPKLTLKAGQPKFILNNGTSLLPIVGNITSLLPISNLTDVLCGFWTGLGLPSLAPKWGPPVPGDGVATTVTSTCTGVTARGLVSGGSCQCGTDTVTNFGPINVDATGVTALCGDQATIAGQTALPCNGWSCTCSGAAAIVSQPYCV